MWLKFLIYCKGGEQKAKNLMNLMMISPSPGSGTGVQYLQYKQGRKRPLDTPKRMIEREKERERQKERYIEREKERERGERDRQVKGIER